MEDVPTEPVDNVVTHCSEEAVLRDRIRSLEILNRVGTTVAADLDLDHLVQTITDAGVELTRAQFGAFFYNVLDDQGESYLLYSLSGAPREAFDKFPMPRNTAVFGPTFRGEGIVRSDDITQDRRYGLNAPRKGMPPGHLPVRSYLAVPVMSPAGEVFGGLFFGHARPAVFDQNSEEGLTSLAAQAAAAITRARLFALAQREIQERATAETRLALQAEQLELAVSVASVGMWDLNLQTQELYWSDHCRKMFGMSADEPVSMADFHEGLHPADQERIAEIFARACDPGVRGAYDVQYRTVGKNDGIERWVAATGKALFDEQGRGVRAIGTTLDITTVKKHEQHLQLLVNELNHRVKNSLAVVQAVADQTFRASTNLADAGPALTSRLIAIAQAHDLLTDQHWSGAELRDIVRRIEVASGGRAERFRVNGPDVRLSTQAALALSMALHELATNAIKYGALSTPSGHIEIEWGLHPSSEGERLALTWRERDGPPVTPPIRKGFGSRLIERGLAAELDGDVRINYAPDGLVCSVNAQLNPKDDG